MGYRLPERRLRRRLDRSTHTSRRDRHDRRGVLSQAGSRAGAEGQARPKVAEAEVVNPGFVTGRPASVQIYAVLRERRQSDSCSREVARDRLSAVGADLTARAGHTERMDI